MKTVKALNMEARVINLVMEYLAVLKTSYPRRSVVMVCYSDKFCNKSVL